MTSGYCCHLQGRFFDYPGDTISRSSEFLRVKGDVCDPAGCLSELCIQLAIIMIGKQVFNNFVELFNPYDANRRDFFEFTNPIFAENFTTGGATDRIDPTRRTWRVNTRDGKRITTCRTRGGWRSLMSTSKWVSQQQEQWLKAVLQSALRNGGFW